MSSSADVPLYLNHVYLLISVRIRFTEVRKCFTSLVHNERSCAKCVKSFENVISALKKMLDEALFRKEQLCDQMFFSEKYFLMKLFFYFLIGNLQEKQYI